MASKGTKRGASPLLAGAEEKESKKLNLENGSEQENDMSKLSDSGQGDTDKLGDGHDQRKVDNDLEIAQIKADVRKLKAIARSQRDEIREGITAMTNKLGEMFIAHAATATSANFYGDFMEEINTRLMDVELNERTLDKKIDKNALMNQKTLAKVNMMEKDVNENTQERKSGNLVLNGVPEKENEDCLVTATNYLRHIDPNFQKNQLLNAYRLGKKGGSTSKHRTLLVKFREVSVKEDIVRKKKVLKNKKDLAKFHCNEDLPPAVRKVRQEMREIAKYALKIGYSNAKATGNKLQIDDKIYYEDELYLLPNDLHMSNIKTRPIGGGIGFQSEYSYMSNFYPCQIKMHQSVFSSAEQAYFFHKAIICEKEEAGIKLKELDDPKVIKAKGDKIPTCDAWEKSKEKVMRNVLLQKFIQNPELKAKLMGTSGSRLMECTNNRFWGTGWFLDDPQWNVTNEYPGKNVLGTMLEGIRDSFDLDILNSSEAIAELEEPMDCGPSKVESNGGNTDTNDQAPINNGLKKAGSGAVKAPVLREGVVAFASPMKRPAGKSVKELSKLIMPTLLDQPTDGPMATEVGHESMSNSQTIAKGAPDEQGACSVTPSADEVAEPDNFDAISFTSSIFSDGNDSFDARNVTLPNGRLNVEKLMGWSLPTVNLSKVLERSACKSPETRGKIMKLIRAQKQKSNPSTSTPAVGNISTIRSTRKNGSSSSKSTTDSSHLSVSRSEKDSIRKMLTDMNA